MRWITFFLVALFAIPLIGQESIVGIWDLGKENTHMEIYRSGEIWEGKAISSDNEKMKVGTLMLRNLVYQDGVWKGEFYIPKMKSWAKVTLTMEGENIRMTIRKSLMKKKIILMPVKSN